MSRSLRNTCTLVRKIFYLKRHCVFYSYAQSQGDGHEDNQIQVYSAYCDIPSPFRSEVLPHCLLNPMFYRLQRGGAKLLCFSRDGQRLEAYGWIQDWRYFRRQFKTISEKGVMLGPYWTSPASRRQGLYSRLLAKSLSLCSKDHTILIYTSPDNAASQRGIEKAGFVRKGEWELFRWLWVFSRIRNLQS